MIGPREEPQIVRGHARPRLGWKDRRTLREIQDRIQARESELFMGVPLLKSDAPPLTYEALIDVMRALERQYPRTLPISVYLELPRPTFADYERIDYRVQSWGWGIDVLTKKQEPQT